LKALLNTIALGLLAAAATAPSPAPPGPPVFESQLDLVYVTVTVLDPAGRVVPDLPVSAFEVREDGKPRPVSVFSHPGDEGVALDVALLLDTSGSSGRSVITQGARHLSWIHPYRFSRTMRRARSSSTHSEIEPS
jgi:hypothetical protein